MFRDPITNRFVAGQPPERTPEGFVVENNSGPAQSAPTAPRGGRYTGGWDFISTPGMDSDTKGGETHAVSEVLGTGQAFKGAQAAEMNYKERKPDGVPVGRSHSESPRG